MIFVNRWYPTLTSSGNGKLLFSTTFVTLIVSAYFIFQERSEWVMRDGVLTYRDREDLVGQLFHARRALELSDTDAGRKWYLVETDTNGVLCLWDNLPSGPIGSHGSNPHDRAFPCTEFTRYIHKKEKFTVEVSCAGKPIAPVVITLPDYYEDWLYSYLPKDGDCVLAKTFEEVRADLEKAIGSSTRPPVIDRISQ